MSRQASEHEKVLFEILREYGIRFYYERIYKVIAGERFKVKIEKNKEEMIGRALVSFPGGESLNYELKYNRIVNLSEGYTLHVSGLKTG